MGTLYYAVNDEKQEAYSLGKNSYCSINDNADKLSLEDRVALQYEGNANFTREDTDKIAQDLKKYEPFYIISEHESDNPKYHDFMVTGSRFLNDSDVGDYLFDPISRHM